MQQGLEPGREVRPAAVLTDGLRLPLKDIVPAALLKIRLVLAPAMAVFAAFISFAIIQCADGGIRTPGQLARRGTMIR